MVRLARAFVLLFVAANVCGCPPADKRQPPPSKKDECAHVGQSCEYSPGKLGACVEKDDCTPPANCFVCQSQH